MKQEDDTFRFYVRNSCLTVGTTLRGTDASDSDPYSGFSLCHYTGDDKKHFRNCLKKLCQTLGSDEGRIVVPRQTHSANVLVLTEESLSHIDTEDKDAIVTNVPGIVTGINTADCVPVVIYDTETMVTGVAHAGWRGALGGVIGNTVKAMAMLGAIPGRCKAIIAPSICSKCFEVGEEVAALFPEAFVHRERGCKPHVDLKGFVTSRLVGEGLAGNSIYTDPDCTLCRPDKFFSARALGISSGRNFTFAVMNNHLE